MVAEHWKQEPDEHDFPAAKTYLSLLCDPATADQIVSLLENAQTSTYQAKDLLRASGLSLLPRDNVHVKGDFKKIEKGRLLSPVLLVRSEVIGDRALVVADGYHRICTSYWINENAQIPCRIVTWSH
jgi:hypothetical protein